MAVKKIVIFDTETTGLPKIRNQIALLAPNCWPDMVSISWSLFHGKEKIKQTTHLIRPDGWIIPEDSIKIHGITQELAHFGGVPLKQVMEEFEKDFSTADHIIAHNLDFDKNVIFNAYKWRLGVDPTAIWPKRGDICTMRNSEMEIKLPAARKTPTGYKSPSLKELWIDTFKTDPPSNAHSASRDVEVLEKICLIRWEKTIFL
jgi:DNA polymerase III epsilon subunit-like protein